MKRFPIYVILLLCFMSCDGMKEKIDFFTLSSRMGLDVFITAKFPELSGETVLVLNNKIWESFTEKERSACLRMAFRGAVLFFLEPSAKPDAPNFRGSHASGVTRFGVFRYLPSSGYRRFSYSPVRVLEPRDGDRVLAGTGKEALLLENTRKGTFLIASSRKIVEKEGIRTRSLPILLLRYLYEKKISKMILMSELAGKKSIPQSDTGVLDLLLRIPVLLLVHFFILFVIFCLYRGKRFGPVQQPRHAGITDPVPPLAVFLKKSGDTSLVVIIEREYTLHVVTGALSGPNCNDEDSVRKKLMEHGFTHGDIAMLYGSTIPADKRTREYLLVLFRKLQDFAVRVSQGKE